MSTFEATFGDPLSADFDPESQQGMSPSTVGARQDVTLGRQGDEVQRAGAGEASLALRAMAVTSPGQQQDRGWAPQSQEQREFVSMMTAAGQGGRPMEQESQAVMMGAVHGSEMNVAEAAAWSVEAFSTRRALPSWMQRIGTFFQEMRAQQANGQMWPPSPFPSPPQARPRQRALASSPSEGPRSEGSLFSREQVQQMQEMQGRAPLLYGLGASAPRSGEASSGGDSTKEAVEAEVRRQLQGIMGQLESSKQEASQLRAEVERLRMTTQSSAATGNGATSLNMPSVSGEAAGPVSSSLNMPSVSGVAAGPVSSSLNMPSVSGVATGPLSSSLNMPSVSGVATGPVSASLNMPSVSGFAADPSGPSPSLQQEARLAPRMSAATTESRLRGIAGSASRSTCRVWRIPS